MKEKIILASNSPRRKEILGKIIRDFVVIPSNFEEDMNKNISPEKMVRDFSKGKALDVAKKVKSGIVIGVDTFVIFKHHKLGKPLTHSIAKEMLKKISGKTITVISGITIINVSSGKKITSVEKTYVKMKKMSKIEIDYYSNLDEPLDAAGAFKIQGFGSIFIERIDGCYYNIMGFPINKIYTMLNKIGYNVL